MNVKNLDVANMPKQDRVLQWVKNDRMAGFVPSWVSADKANSANNANNQKPAEITKSAQATKEAFVNQTPQQNISASEDNFGFLDLVDMVNPLQHIPLLNLAYRGITGDQIKPISKIIGGGVFGGPMGVASGIVDTVITQETGKDMAGNAIALVKGDAITLKNSETAQEKIHGQMQEHQNETQVDIASALLEQPPMQMAEATFENANANVTATITAAAPAASKVAALSYDRIAFLDDRTAGYIAVYA